MRVIGLGIVAVLALAGCKQEPVDPLEALAPNEIWEVVEIAGQPVPHGVEVTLTHPEPDLIAGVSGCNRYNGRIARQDGRVRVGELVGTRMMCPDATMAVEQGFRSSIQRIDDVKIVGDRLELLAAGKPVIVATR